MSLKRQTTVALQQELRMALRANAVHSYKSWLALGIEQLVRELVAEVESEWMLPLLIEEQPGGQGLSLPFRRELLSFRSPRDPAKFHRMFFGS